MAYRELELTLVSARELKNVNLLTRMDVYAVVSISGNPMTRQCTAPDPSGGRNPRWDATFRFAVPPTAAAAAGSCLHVLLRAERVLGDRDVGEVVVPLAELLAGAPAAGPQQPQVASYQVRKVHRWEPRGVLNLSYRLGPVVAPVGAERKPPPTAVKADPYPPVGVPVPSSPPSPPPPPRPAAKPKHDPVPAPAPWPRNGKSNGLGLEGPTQVCVGPHTQIFLGGTAPTTMSSSPTGSNVSSPRKAHGAWPKQELLHHDHDHDHDHDTAYASAAQSIFSPRKEHHQGRRSFQETEATSQRALIPSASSREAATTTTVSPRGPSRQRPPVSTFSSHGSSSSPPPCYSPSPTNSSAHSSTTNSPYYTARHTSTTHASPRPLGRSSPLVANHTSMVPS